MTAGAGAKASRQVERSAAGLPGLLGRARPGVGPIVVVGGYGQVGRQVAELLAPAHPGRVLLVGRNQRSADQAARQVGHGTRGQLLDTADPDRVHDTLTGAALAVCTAPAPAGFAAACLAAGVHYLDVTADIDLLEQLQALHPLAVTSGASAVLSVGLAPGLSTLLATQAASALDDVERLDVLVLLGLGDVHGPAAIDWTLDGLGRTLPGVQDSPAVGAFTTRRHFLLPRSSGQPDDRVTGYRFGFPDEATLPRLTGASHAATWLALQPAPVARFLAANRAVLVRHLRRPALRRTVAGLLRRVQLGSDRAAVVVTATGSSAGRPQVVRAAADGRDESHLTALVAAYVAEQLLSGATPPGVRHLPEVVDAAGLSHWLDRRTTIAFTVDPPRAPQPAAGPNV